MLLAPPRPDLRFLRNHMPDLVPALRFLGRPPSLGTTSSSCRVTVKHSAGSMTTCLGRPMYLQNWFTRGQELATYESLLFIWRGRRAGVTSASMRLDSRSSVTLGHRPD